MPAYLVTLPERIGYTLPQGADRMVVFAADGTQAKQMCAAKFDGDANSVWTSDAIATEIVAASTWADWNMNIRAFDPATGIHAFNVDIPAPAADVGQVLATGTLTFAQNAADTNTVTIGSKVYTFQDTLTNVDGNVKIGANAAATIVNLVAAIMLGAGAGTGYAAAMTVHPTVTAVDGAGDTVVVSSKTAVAAATANAIATTDTLAGASAFGAATLSGGVDGGSIDAWGQAAVVALEAAEGAALTPSYVIATNTLTVAAIADDIGDHRLVVTFESPDSETNVASLLGTVVDEGASAAVLTVVLPADNVAVPQVVAALKRT